MFVITNNVYLYYQIKKKQKNKTIMSVRIITLGLVSASLFLASCSGGGEQAAAKEQATKEVKVAEKKAPEVAESASNPVSYTMSVEESKIEWKGTKKIGGGHNGEIKVSKGSIELTDGKISGGSFEVDMNSITCLDLEDAETNQKLVGHLKAPDFFAVDSFPTATLLIKGLEGENVKADLTIRGITSEVTFIASTTTDESSMMGNATVVFDRTKYKSQYGSENFFENLGDKVINDDIELKISLKGTK